MKDLFFSLVDQLQNQLQGGEEFAAYFCGEYSDFVRFNRGKVRQPGHVAQAQLNLRLIQGNRHASEDMSLTGNHAPDLARVNDALMRLRDRLQHLPEDPHLLLPSEPASSELLMRGGLPESGQMCTDILEAATDLDLVGIMAAGPVFRGFANSRGQRNWLASDTFTFDWSVYTPDNHAIKGEYSGNKWDAARVRERIQDTQGQLEYMSRSETQLEPGEFRAYLAPSAVGELVDMMGWDGFSKRAHMAKTSPFLSLAEGSRSLSDDITIREKNSEGQGVPFNQVGFVKPEEVTLIEKGKFKECLTSPRSAKEFSVDTNGADLSESPECLELEPGVLAQKDALEALGDGLYINNLWYLNHSDRNSFRVTGMTRYGAFLVKDGKIAGPIAPMRFDDSIYSIFGEQLEALTREQETLASTDTYGMRHLSGDKLPGLLVKGFRFTL